MTYYLKQVLDHTLLVNISIVRSISFDTSIFLNLFSLAYIMPYNIQVYTLIFMFCTIFFYSSQHFY